MTRTGWIRALASAMLGLVVHVAALTAQQAIPRPQDVIGFEPGADYKLVDFEQMAAYLRQLDAASDRVEVVELGRTTLGRPLLQVLISSPENLRQKDRFASISQRLMRARDLTDPEARQLAREGKTVVFLDGGIHASEVAGHQRMPWLAYNLAAGQTEEIRRILDNVIVVLVPSMNPDGMTMVAEWYRSNVGTPFETAPMPYLYHHFVGHDNNRDWAMMTQVETKAVTKMLYEKWFPQIMFNVHQTGPYPSRIEIPPFGDPVNPNIHPLVTRSTTLIGDFMAKRFEEERKPGVIQYWHYDMWRADGTRFTGYGHNIIGVHTETQLYRYATPIYDDPKAIPDFFEGEAGGGQTVSAKNPSIFYSNPWRGGWWRLRDAVDYIVTADMAILDAAARLKEDFLYNVYTMGKDAIANKNGPFAYVIAAEQWDSGEAAELVRVLRRAGVEVNRATSSFTADGKSFGAGTYVVYGAQAFRPFLGIILDKQVYPESRLYPGGPPNPPYDLAGWTFPISMGVDVARVAQPFQASVEPVDQVTLSPGQVAGDATYGYVLSPRQNASTLAVSRLLKAGDRVGRATTAFEVGGKRQDPGAFIIERRGGADGRVAALAKELGLSFVGIAQAPGVTLERLRPPRIGLYKSWVASMDEGWTRWLLANQYEFAVDTLHDADVRAGNLSRYDVIILPDGRPDQILNGYLPGTMPEPYVGGMGADGVAALRRYLVGGGRVVAIDNAADFAIQQFGLPVRNATAGLPEEEFYIPGSLMRMVMNDAQPLAWGMPGNVAAMFADSRAFSVVPSARAGDKQAPAQPVDVVAKYATDDLLMSGWEIGAQEHLANRAAVLRVGVGAGDVVLIGFQPISRSYTRGAYKLLFNAVLGSATGTP